MFGDHIFNVFVLFYSVLLYKQFLELLFGNARYSWNLFDGIFMNNWGGGCEETQIMYNLSYLFKSQSAFQCDEKGIGNPLEDKRSEVISIIYLQHV